MENIKHQRKDGVQLFINKELELEVKAIKNEDGSISLNAEDSAIGLGWYQVKNGKKYPKWERVNSFISEFGNSPQVGKGDFIPESLFYLLAMKANNDIAKKFQMWLAVEVIPQIRKTGGYVPISEEDDEASIMAKALEIAHRTLNKKDELLKAKDKEIKDLSEDLNQKNRFINQLAASENTLLVREVAKVASKADVVIGEKRLWSKLREWGLIFKNSTEPKQCGVDRGYFEVNEGTKEAKGKVFTYRTTRVTGKGQAYIIERLLKEIK